MNVLIACEESQAVCIEMRRLGHRAFSCDIQDCSGGHPEWHIKGDVLPILNGRCEFDTADGTHHVQTGRWDLIIAHPLRFNKRGKRKVERAPAILRNVRRRHARGEMMAELKPYDIIVHIEPITPGTDGKISFQAKEAGVLVRCESCRYHVDTVRFPGDVSRVWCMVFYRDMKCDGYCSIGQRGKE